LTFGQENAEVSSEDRTWQKRTSTRTKQFVNNCTLVKNPKAEPVIEPGPKGWT
jgi:hypothetical protein